MLHAGGGDRLPELVALVRVAPERLLAEHVLAGLRGGDRRRRVEVVRPTVVEEADRVVLDQVAPVRHGPFVAELPGRVGDGLLVAAGDRDEARHERRRPRHRPDRVEGVRVRPAHEGVAQHPDADLAQVGHDSALSNAASKATSGRGEVGPADEASGVRRAPVAVHAGVLPLDRERALVADPVERAEELLEVDVAVAGRDEVPAARVIAEAEVRAEDRAASVEPFARVLHVHVVDAVGELEHERSRVEQLVGEVARVEVDAEALAVPDRVERPARGDEVVGDLGRVHLEAEADALPVEDVHDRAPAVREVLVAAVDLGEVVGRERVEQVPDRRAGEAVHLLHAERAGRAGRVLHPLGRALAHALGVAVAPDLRRQDVAVTVVDRIADGLADQVRAERPALEAVALEQVALGLHVAGVGERLVDLEVVAPAGELEPVEAPAGGLLGQALERQVCPLAGEERHGSRHPDSFRECAWDDAKRIRARREGWLLKTRPGPVPRRVPAGRAMRGRCDAREPSIGATACPGEPRPGTGPCRVRTGPVPGRSRHFRRGRLG